MNIEHTQGLRDIPVKIKCMHPDAVIPMYATELAAGFDLVAVEDVIIAPGETKLVPLGFAVQIPEGFEMQIRPRSGVAYKTKLRVGNSPGTIDADFRGEVKVIVDNIAQYEYVIDYDLDWDGERSDYRLRKTGFALQDVSGKTVRDFAQQGNSYIVRKGDRIAQGVITPVYRADFIGVDELDETVRGGGGFGHTGVTSN